MTNNGGGAKPTGLRGRVARLRLSGVRGVRKSLIERARARLPDLPVTRTVQGVTLSLPWSHRLPDYAREHPTYGQNLVRLAKALAIHRSGPLRVVDVGANVGDSALQISGSTDCRVLCVEGDEQWLWWLRRNVSGTHSIAVEPSLLVGNGAGGLVPVRARGTTQFRSDASGQRGITAQELRERHPDFATVDLIKIDTDGYDCALAPALASAWAESRPVLFFEFDPTMTSTLGQPDPWSIFGDLSALGYVSGVVWDNFGALIGWGPLRECVRLCAPLREPRERREFDYADIAVAVAADDPVLRAVG